MNFIESCIRHIAPHECIQCAAEGYLLCETCLGTLPAPRPSASCGVPVHAVTTYIGVGRQLIHYLKFERAVAAAADAARGMANVVSNNTYDIVTYVPTATSRVRQRGYDQARQMAQQLAWHLHLPCVPLLARTGQQRQVGAARAQRTQQMRKTFRSVHAYAGCGQRVLLVDDVITTGSTIGAASRCLYAAGVNTVEAVVFAVA